MMHEESVLIKNTKRILEEQNCVELFNTDLYVFMHKLWMQNNEKH
jgi:hypothetical protein